MSNTYWFFLFLISLGVSFATAKNSTDENGEQKTKNTVIISICLFLMIFSLAMILDFGGAK